ncbi:hypothetical protein KJW28_18795 [Pseudomonas syringae pv. aptata]|uniref:hypothetical protein n=1 Tax=Pseudomonas syringae TaxID=317 RepID=UPI001FFCD839|nr:hypothetical protein [Pseudomonas syringae]MCK0549666.1 hypothetical protein [Pseudomonas syringae pv. aptata]
MRLRYQRLPKLIELRIRKAERLRVAQGPSVISPKQVSRACAIANRLFRRKATIEAEFLRRASDVNYRAIYQALEAIENSETGDTCPACLTPLDRVSVNPFERARHELQALSALEQLKYSKRRNDERIAYLASRVATGLTIVKANEQAGVPCILLTDDLQVALSDFHAATDRAEVASIVLRLFLELRAKYTSELEAYLQACQRKSNEVAQAEAQAAELERQTKELSQLGEVLRRLFDEKRTAESEFKIVSNKMADLSAQKAELMNDATDNSHFNLLLKNLEIEYGNLYRDLLTYKLTLEKSRISGIEAKAAEYYRAINNHDDEHEQIDSLSFDKVADSYRIKISNADGSSLDAFSILSEGHLRALGLSLLLAMAQKNKFPLIVFDDVVNAIDSDHRSNIIDLFFSDPYLRQIQW